MEVEIPDLEKAKYIKAMSDIADYSDEDKELAHIYADRLLCEILEEIGLSEVVEEFDRCKKWYA